MDDLVLPRYTSPLCMLAVFLVALVVFHLLLVRLLPLDKVGWKKVDYIWLTLALLGIIGGVGSARQEVASNMVSRARSRMEFAATQVEDRLSFGSSPAICRTFVRTEMSPSPEVFDRIQREFDQQCRWFRAAAERLQKTLFAKREALRLEDLGVPQEGGNGWAVTSLQDSIRRYNTAVMKVQELSEAIARSLIEEVLIAFGPFLLALALALRITKVTGEIRLETHGDPPRDS